MALFEGFCDWYPESTSPGIDPKGGSQNESKMMAKWSPEWRQSGVRSGFLRGRKKKDVYGNESCDL